MIDPKPVCPVCGAPLDRQLAQFEKQLAMSDTALDELQQIFTGQLLINKGFRDELAQHRALFGEAVEVVKRVSEYEPKYDGFSCAFCNAGFFNVPHQHDCIKLIAQALIPKLEKAAGGKG